MSEQARIGLDNPVFDGRLRRRHVTSVPRARKADPEQRLLTDYIARQPDETQLTAEPRAQNIQTPWADWFSTAEKMQTTSPGQGASIAAFVTANAALAPQAVEPKLSPGLQVDLEPIEDEGSRQTSFAEALQDYATTWINNLRTRLESKLRRHSALRLSLLGAACLVFVIGLLTSLQTTENNHNAQAQISALFKQVSQQTAGSVLQSTVPSIDKPTDSAFSQYSVAPDLPRYIRISKLGVNARVMQVGATNSGTLAIPDNVNDTAWYSGSAKPGQPGATLIEGYVSSLTTPGAFSNLKNLVSGDTIQVERGDGTVLNYEVVKTQAYSADNVDMQAAVTPIIAGRPGLNLITCNGQVAPGSTDYNQRLIVFADQI